MEYNIFSESSIWRNSRERRIVAFVRIAAWLMIGGSLLWVPLMYVYRLHVMNGINAAVIVAGLYVLRLLKQDKTLAARTLLFITAVCNFLIICLFVDGPDDFTHERGEAHFWFLVLAAASYFVLYDVKPFIRDSVPLALLALFFLFHFKYISIHPLLNFPGKEFLNRMTIITSLLILFFVTRQFTVQITKAEKAETLAADRLEGLIESMLPKSVAERLRREGKTFADEFHDCSVLFADIVGFSTWAENHSANEVVDRLNSIFSKFDELVEQLKLTKIKTIGDSYMVAAGVPEYRSDHAVTLTRLALQMNAMASQQKDLRFRIGINSGSAVAGVIGKKIFLYDLWGDTVNIASRMESSSEEGKVNISASTYELVKSHFKCVHRGKIEAKNKGMIDMYFVESEQ